jgi:hypothetical protein
MYWSWRAIVSNGKRKTGRLPDDAEVVKKLVAKEGKEGEVTEE